MKQSILLLKSRFLAAIFWAFGGSLFGQTCTGNVLTNAGFESALAGWTSSGAATTAAGGATGQAASICSNGTRIFQTQAAMEAKTYTFKIFARNNGSAATGTLAIKFMSSGFAPLVSEFFSVTNSASFTEFSVSKLAPTGTAFVEISIIKESGAGCLLADDCCLTDAVGGCSPDVTKPVFSNCPTGQTLSTAGATATATWTEPVLTDNCALGSTPPPTHPSGFAFPIGKTTVVYSAYDAAFNFGTCAFEIAVNSTATGAGCGFEKQAGAFPTGFQSVPVMTQNTATGGSTTTITANPSFPITTFVIRTATFDAAGNLTQNLTETMPDAFPSREPLRMADGNFLIVDPMVGNNIPIRKITPAGVAIWSKNVAFTPPAGTVQSVTVSNAVIAEDGFFIGGTIISGPVGPTPVWTPFLIKTDFEGIKISQPTLGPTTQVGTSFGLAMVGKTGNAYFNYFPGGRIGLIKYNPAGTRLYDISSLTDTPSSAPGSIHESTDNHTLYISYYSNSFSYLRRINGTTGVNEWEVNMTQKFTLGQPPNDFFFTRMRGSVTTQDGGVVLAFSYSFPGGFGIPGYIYAKFDAAGNVVWSRHNINIGDLRPILATTDGGYLFAGQKSTGSPWTFVKTNSNGDILPTCTGGTTLLPDLTISNPQKTIFQALPGVTVPFTLNLQNIGTAAAPGNFSIKTYLSQDQLFSANDVLVGTFPTSNLAAGAVIPNLALTLTTAANQTPGNFFVIMRVDSDNQIVESNESNNVLSEFGFTLQVQQPTSGGCAGNLLTNASFENNFMDWDNGGGATIIGAGNTGLGARLCTNGARIFQTKPATVGKTYHFKAFSKNNGAAAAGTLAIKFLSAAWQPLASEFAPMTNSATYVEYMVSKTAPAGAAWVEVSVIKESGAGCLLFDDGCLTDGGGTGGSDLKITISADKTTVPQWGNVTFSITARNEGTAPIASATIKIGGCAAGVFQNFDGPFKLVYAGTPGAPTAGAYNFVTQEWTISNLAAGAQGVLTVPLFTTSTSEKKVVAFASAQSPSDSDSQPSGSIFSNCTAAQDDEAIFTINFGNPLFQSAERAEKGSSIALAGLDFSILPNPSAGEAQLFLPLFLDQKMEITVVDALGKMVFSEKIERLESSFFDLDLSGENAGVFLVRVQAENGRAVVKRLIINKL